MNGTGANDMKPFLFIFALVMKRVVFILLAIFSILTGCTKKEPIRTSGIDTIDNITYLSTTYYNYGFSFSGAKLIATSTTPGPDITIYVNIDNITPRLTLQSNNLKPSFFKVGDFADEATAQSAFDNLKTVSVAQWQDMADPLNTNQVWIYKTGNDTYAKIRIVSTVNETRQGEAYGECTFQWVYQPDGSLTFPGK
jgi:hypothetical protein